MTLRKKSISILIALFMVLLLLLDLTFTNFLRSSAEKLAEQRMEQDLARARAAIDGETQALYAVSEFWANSDETWEFMRGNNPAFAENNLDRSIFKMLGISSMIFFDNEYNARLLKNYGDDDPSYSQREFETIIADSMKNSALLENIPVSGLKGVADGGGEPILFSIQPIFNSKMDRERAGFLLMTRSVTPNLINRLSQNIGFSFAVERAAESEKSGEQRELIISGGPDRGLISGRRLIVGIGGEPLFWITGETKNEGSASSERKIQFMFLTFAAVGLCFCLFCDRIFKRLIWDRICRIQKELRESRDDPAELRITDDVRKDELSDLARTINDSYAYISFAKEQKLTLDNMAIKVYKRFSQEGSRLCVKTLEDIATAFTPRDESFRGSLPRLADTTREFARRMGFCEEDCFYMYLGALFSRIGLLGLPYAARRKKWELSASELREYQKYPVFSREFMESIELLRYAATIPYSWKENWDGSGFPRGAGGVSIPPEARIFAVVNEWHELTRQRPGRKPPDVRELEAGLRERGGTRLDPNLVEEFIKFLSEEKKNGGNNNEGD